MYIEIFRTVLDLVSFLDHPVVKLACYVTVCCHAYLVTSFAYWIMRTKPSVMIQTPVQSQKAVTDHL